MENIHQQICCNRLNQRSYSDTCHSHQHSFHQLILPRRGRLELQCGKHGGEAISEQGALIPAGEAHAFSSTGDNVFWVIDVVATEHNQALFDLSKRSPFFRLNSSIQAQMDFAERHGPLLAHAEVQHLWSSALVLSLQTQSRINNEAQHTRLLLALTLMQARVQYGFDVHELAAEIHMSSTQLHRLFKHQLRTTPQRWMNTLRMQLASQLLTIGLELPQVALQCGFADQSSFGKAFKRFYGLPPALWLKAKTQHLPTTGKPGTRKV